MPPDALRSLLTVTPLPVILPSSSWKTVLVTDGMVITTRGGYSMTAPPQNYQRTKKQTKNKQTHRQTNKQTQTNAVICSRPKVHSSALNLLFCDQDATGGVLVLVLIFV